MMIRTALLQPEDGNQRLTDKPVPIKGTNMTLDISEPSLITLFGHIAVQNESEWKKAETKQADTNAMVGMHLTLNGKRINGSMSTRNVTGLNITAMCPLSALVQINKPGKYEIAVEAWMMLLPGTPRPKDIVYSSKTLNTAA